MDSLMKDLEQALEIGSGACENRGVGGRGFGESVENSLARQPGAIGQELEKVVVTPPGPGD